MHKRKSLVFHRVGFKEESHPRSHQGKALTVSYRSHKAPGRPGGKSLNNHQLNNEYNGVQSWLQKSKLYSKTSFKKSTVRAKISGR